jgi:uncharacterized Fe-S cluster-containing radical SAM superfamily protein
MYILRAKMKMEIPFNPIERAKEVESVVVNEEKRKYYRFRYANYYGGIVTADTIGCCFLCAYCWNYFRNLNFEHAGKFYSPSDVVNNLLKISSRKNCERFRISGAEPILGEKSFSHLEKILELLKQEVDNLEFIIETNGLILGYKTELIEKLKKYKEFVFVRISLKGWDETSFEKISGAKRDFFIYPIKALRILKEEGIEAWPAVMYDIFKDNGLRKIKEILKREIGSDEVEIEYLEAYPFVVENLKRRGIEF